MQRFDCLGLDTPLLGWHLLEASAGTGKTFAIEHIFARLLLNQIPIEEILVVTFTKAATRQLKERIYLNLLRIEKMLSSEEEISFAYLIPLKGSIDALRLIRDALRGFDRVCIFTIHGFCFRMMQEFSLEANLINVQNQKMSSFEMTRRLKKEGISFLKRNVPFDVLCPEQIACLLHLYDTIDDLAKALLKTSSKECVSFLESHLLFQKAVRSYAPVDSSFLKEDFFLLKDQYKGFKKEFESHLQILGESLAHPESEVSFRKLLQVGSDLFYFFSLKNRKVKAKEVSNLHDPQFFAWAELHLAPIIDQAANVKNILANLSILWKKWEEEVLFREGICSPDAILSFMAKAIDDDVFRKKVASRFQAVMIDEFQDTDPLQWNIFQKTFLDVSKTLYLVGDPKQSIYRFRSADVYTYFAAKDFLGRENCYHLDTNYRSTKEMIGGLNALFSRSWLKLPKIGSHIEYIPVQAGLSLAYEPPDDKKAIHFVIQDEMDDEDAFFIYAASEIQRLQAQGNSSIAILVKDRYEMQRACLTLRKYGISFVSKSHETLGKTRTFSFIYELFDAIFSPSNESGSAIVNLGPFRVPFEKGAFYWRRFIEEEGFSAFCYAFFYDCNNLELRQILEALLQWEQNEGFSFLGLMRFLDEFEELDAEEGGRKEIEEGLNAVEILTMHVSKGLEFDIVFAWGLISHPPMKEEENEEENAEKLRQLYVAMTRAKCRLYVPYRLGNGRKKASPMQLFSEIVESTDGPFLNFLEEISQKESISIEKLKRFEVRDVILTAEIAEDLREEDVFGSVKYQEVYIQSFSSMVEPKESLKRLPSVQDPLLLPRGKEVGNVVHEILEEMFRSRFPVWQDFAKMDEWVEKKLRVTFLAAWKEEIQQMIRDALSHPLIEGFSLKDLQPDEVMAEMEFLYQQSEREMMKGFIDLVFCREGRFYFLDWKTNVLENQTAEEVMQVHQYELQASLYKEALRRHFGSDADFERSFGGAFYCFIRERKWVQLYG